MKALIIATMLMIIAATSAHCRVGETLSELNARFGGEGKKNSAHIRMPGHDQWYFEKDGFGVQCVMTDDKCVMEVYHRIGQLITDGDISDLLKAEAEGHGWGFDKKTARWTRSDYKLQAFREPGHKDMFYVEELEKRHSGKSGF